MADLVRELKARDVLLGPRSIALLASRREPSLRAPDLAAAIVPRLTFCRPGERICPVCLHDAIKLAEASS